MAFERLFGDGTSPEERKTGRKQDASILDSVAQQISYFKKPLGAVDRGAPGYLSGEHPRN